jgi:hypothetical protein
LYYNHYQLSDGTSARVLDVIDIRLKEAKPLPHQPENWLMDEGAWELIERPATGKHLDVVRAAVTTASLLFGDRSDRIRAEIFEHTPAAVSLVLVRPTTIHWGVERNPVKGTKKARAHFSLGAIPYDLGVTDPDWSARIRKLSDGIHDITETGIPAGKTPLLCISLSEPTDFDQCCYKLAATVIPD